MDTTIIMKQIFEQFDYQNIKNTCNYILAITGIYLLWIGIHYITPHMYVYLCVPPTFIGILMSPFASTMPHCQGMRWLLYTSSDSIKAMWFVLSTWCFGKIQNYMKTSEQVMNVENTEKGTKND